MQGRRASRLITEPREAIDELELKVGVSATAVIKASDVMIALD